VGGGNLIPVSGSGINDVVFNGICVHPNPTSTVIRVENDKASASKFNFGIYDLMGKLVESGTSEYGGQISISELITGNYLIKIKNNDANGASAMFLKE
jgi:hypothetical protein